MNKSDRYSNTNEFLSTKSSNSKEYKYKKDYEVEVSDFDTIDINTLEKDRKFKVNLLYYSENIFKYLFKFFIYFAAYELIINKYFFSYFNIYVLFIHYYLSLKYNHFSQIIFLVYFNNIIGEYTNYKYDVIIVLALLTCLIKNYKIKLIMCLVLAIVKLDLIELFYIFIFFLIIPYISENLNKLAKKWLIKFIKFDHDKLIKSDFSGYKLVLYHNLLINKILTNKLINKKLIEVFILNQLSSIINKNSIEEDINLKIINLYLKNFFENKKLKFKNYKRELFLKIIKTGDKNFKYVKKIDNHLVEDCIF